MIEEMTRREKLARAVRLFAEATAMSLALVAIVALFWALYMSLL